MSVSGTSASGRSRWARSPTSCSSAARPTRRCASTSRIAFRSRSGCRTWIRSRTSDYVVHRSDSIVAGCSRASGQVIHDELVESFTSVSATAAGGRDRGRGRATWGESSPPPGRQATPARSSTCPRQRSIGWATASKQLRSAPSWRASRARADTTIADARGVVPRPGRARSPSPRARRPIVSVRSTRYADGESLRDTPRPVAPAHR